MGKFENHHFAIPYNMSSVILPRTYIKARLLHSEYYFDMYQQQICYVIHIVNTVSKQIISTAELSVEDVKYEISEIN